MEKSGPDLFATVGSGDYGSLYFWVPVFTVLAIIAYILVQSFISSISEKKVDFKESGIGIKITRSTSNSRRRKTEEQGKDGVKFGSKRPSTIETSEIVKKLRVGVAGPTSSSNEDDSENEEGSSPTSTESPRGTKKTLNESNVKTGTTQETNPFIPKADEGWQTVLPRRRRKTGPTDKK